MSKKKRNDAHKALSPFESLVRKVGREFMRDFRIMEMDSRLVSLDIVDVTIRVIDGMSKKKVLAVIRDLYHLDIEMKAQDLEYGGEPGGSRDVIDNMIYGAVRRRLMDDPDIAEEEGLRQTLAQALTAHYEQRPQPA